MRTRLLILVTVVSLLTLGFSFPRDAEAAGNYVCHYVQRGETLSLIAARYGTTVANLQQINNLWNPSLIYVGQCIRVPIAGAAPPATCGQVHIVQRGEYLNTIAVRYGVTVAAIVQANGLANANLIYVGQRLQIPCTSAPAPKPPTTICYKTHIVQAGEYVKSIALKYGVSATSIIQANGLANANLIYPGQKLKIPTACPKPAPTPAPTAKPPVGPWTAQYWDNHLLSGAPKLTRNEALVNHNWGTTGPGGGIAGTTFSARYTRTRYFEGGTYRFFVTVDDGVRMWVDGVLIIDEWHDSQPITYTTTRKLSAGEHVLKVDYYQNTGSAQIRVWNELVTAPVQWKGEFFNNVKLEGTPKYTQHFSAIDFNWGNKSPIDDITADYFSARFTSEFEFAEGKYRFLATVDDGVRVYLDDELIIDQWNLGSARTYIVEKDLSAGKHKLRVEYFENNGDAVCRFRWVQL